MTAVAVNATSGRTRLVFDGQSLNIQPGLNIGYPAWLRKMLPGIDYCIPAIGDCAWADLINDAPQRSWPYAAKSQRPILMMNGGTNDVGNNDTAAQVYAIFGSYATQARNAGFTYVLANTIPPNTGFTSPQLTVLASANALIKADASHYFDGVADFAGDSRLSDPTNTTYYFDGVHWTSTGAAAAASIMYPIVLPFI